MLVPPQLVESLVRVLVPPPSEEPPESVLTRHQTKALLETVSVETLPGDIRSALVDEEPSERLWLSPFNLLLYEIDVLGIFPLKCLFPSFPSWSRSKWWSVFRIAHSTRYTVLHIVPLILLALAAFCCRFGTTRKS